MKSFLVCNPIYVEKVWGSNDPKDFPGGVLNDKPIGEAIHVVDREDAQSLVVVNGESVPIGAFLQECGKKVMGPRWERDMRFPLIDKTLYSEKCLSLQVHPTADAARVYGGEPKKEFWYVVDAHSGARIFAGLQSGVTREVFERNLREGTLEECIHAIDTHPGHSMMIPPGRLHAIDAGNIIKEIQTSSFTTYRVYDWGRKGLNGGPRTLHVEEALASTDFEDHNPSMNGRFFGNYATLAECSQFAVQQLYATAAAGPIVFDPAQQPRLIHVVQGDLYEEYSRVSLREGQTAILVYGSRAMITTEKSVRFLVTDNFFV